VVNPSTLVLIVCGVLTLGSGLSLLFYAPSDRRAIPLGAALLFASFVPFGFSLLTLEVGPLYSWGLFLLLPAVFHWIGFLSLFAASLGHGSGEKVSPAWRNYSLFNLALGLVVPVWYLLTNHSSYRYIYEGGGYLVTTGLTKYLLAYLLFAVALLLIRFEALYRSAGAEQKLSLRPVLLLSLLHLFPLAFLSSLGILYGATSSGIIVTSWLFVGTSSPLIAAATLRRKVLSLEVEIKPQAAYSSVALFTLGAYLIFLALVAEAVRRLGGDLENLFTFFGGLLLFLVLLALPLSSSLRERISRFVHLSFLSSSRDYRREWSELSDSLATASDIGEIGGTACETFTKQFQPERAAFYLLENESLKLEAHRGGNRPPAELSIAPETRDWIFRNGKAIHCTALPAEMKLREEFTPEILSPLLVAGQLLGLVFLGKKRGRGDYSIEDLSLLDTSCRQIAVATLQSLTWRRLSESEKLESFHQTASFVLHDLKNMVSTLSLLVANAPKVAADPQLYFRGIDSIKTVSDRMRALMYKLSSDLGEGKPNLRTVDLVPLIEQVLSQTASYNDGSVMVSRNLAPGLEVEVDPDMMEKIIHNLVANAYEAMPSGGKLTLSLFPEGERVKLSVQDTGVGMTPEFIKSNLFRPFQSTKRRGLGIGLYQCRKLLERLGGKIDVRSLPDRGCEFILSLPSVSREPRRPVAASVGGGDIASS
jgi:putative PEP-CTERM system histidine kinase